MAHMDTEQLAYATSIIHKMADAAATTIMPYFRATVAIDNKTPGHGYDPVTVADREAELAIRAVIEQHFPNDGIVGEEYGEKTGSSGMTWILDPIDGTRSFVTGIPQWGTLIGLRDGARTVLGLVDQPYLKERYIGSAVGASLHVPGPAISSLSTRSCADVDQAVLMSTSPDFFTPAELAAFCRVRDKVAMTRYGCDCYAYCMLASGYIDLVIESGLQNYDIQPLIPLIEAAGGIITDWQGGQVLEGGTAIAAGDSRCHQQALELLQAV